MKYFRLAGVVLLLILSCFSLPGEAVLGPEFDLRSVSLPEVRRTSPRAVNSMDLLQIRDIHGMSMAPDGRHIAFVVGQALYKSNSYRSGLFVVATRQGSPVTNLGTAGVPHWDDLNQWAGDSEPPQWSRDSRYVTYRMKLLPAAQWQVWRWNCSGGKPVQYSHVPGNVLSYSFILHGSKLVLAVQRPPKTSGDRSSSWRGFLYDGTIRPFRGRPVASEVLAAKPAETETWIHDVASGIERRATAEEVRRWTPSAVDLEVKGPGILVIDTAASPDGRAVAYRLYNSGIAHSSLPGYELYVKPAGGGPSLLLQSGSAYIADYWWSSDSRRIYFSTQNGDGRSPKLMVVSAQGGLVKELFQGPGLVTRFSADKSGVRLACTVEDNITPPQIGVLNLQNGRLVRLVDINPEFKNLTLSHATRIDGTNQFGDWWYGYLLLPPQVPAGKKIPLIITTYTSGDMFLRGASGNEYPLQVFAARGFAVFSMTFSRVPAAEAQAFTQALRMWASPFDSIQSALQRLRQMNFIDIDNAGVTGFSYGAEILEYAISHSKLFRAAVESGSAGRDPFFYYMAGNVWQKRFAEWGLEGWPEGETRERWKQLAAYLNADRVTVPLLTNAADSEFIAGLALYTSLKQLKKPVELFIYPDELHVKNQPRHRYEIYERNTDWFCFWLQGKEDPSPAKAEQYLRWNHLRDLEPRSEEASVGRSLRQ